MCRKLYPTAVYTSGVAGFPRDFTSGPLKSGCSFAKSEHFNLKSNFIIP